MGRSVNYHSQAHKVLYTYLDEEDSEDYPYEWDDYADNIFGILQEVATSFELPGKQEWHDRDVRKIAENRLCSVWISSYGNVVSLSFVPEEEGWSRNVNIRGLAERWIRQITPKIQARLPNSLNKIGSFSNGEEVFEKA